MDPDKPPHPAEAAISDQEIGQRLSFLELGPQDDARLRQVWDLVRGSEDRNIERFYAHIGAFGETGAYIGDPEQRQRLHRAQQRYARELFCEPCDPAYVENRLRVGAVHHRIGLEPHWYLAACAKLLTAVMDSIQPLLREDPEFHADALKSTVRRLFLDIGLAMNAYVAADRQALSASNASLRESQALLSEAHDLAQLARWELHLPAGELHCCPRALAELRRALHADVAADRQALSASNASLRESQALLSEAHDLAQLARWELHLPDGALNCCPRAQEMLHTGASHARGGYERLRRWVHPLDRRDVDAAFRAAVGSGAAYDVRYRVERPDHPPRMLRERGRALPGGDGRTRVVGTIQDISLQASQLSRIEQLALYDDLTRLPNRASFYAELERHIEDAAGTDRVFSILFIDLDEFKEINDTKGHSVGDAVLIEVGKRLKDVLRSGETVARLGGDEFVVLAAGVDGGIARVIAARLAEAIARPMRIGDSVLGLKASIGISVFPADGLSSELLVRNADTAMYAAKHSRGGIDAYHPQMSARLARRVQLADRLEHALREGTLALHFQPQVAIADGRAVGAEALLRWQDEVLGTVSPEEFVPLAEHRGLIEPLGDWVLAAACARLHDWDRRGLRLPGRLAINLSPRQFDDPGFARRLTDTILGAGLAPDRFDLELTESGLMADPDAALATLYALKEAGFQLSLDDFGMGYSSLAHLKGFPLHRLKLDRAFVRGMLEHRHDYAIVVATIAMARSLDLELTAEGVESRDQADALHRLGCRYAQGFLYDPALADAEFAARWLGAAPA